MAGRSRRPISRLEPLLLPDGLAIDLDRVKDEACRSIGAVYARNITGIVLGWTKNKQMT
jgi:hypothetical protein